MPGLLVYGCWACSQERTDDGDRGEERRRRRRICILRMLLWQPVLGIVCLSVFAFSREQRTPYRRWFPMAPSWGGGCNRGMATKSVCCKIMAMNRAMVTSSIESSSSSWHFSPVKRALRMKSQGRPRRIKASKQRRQNKGVKVSMRMRSCRCGVGSAVDAHQWLRCHQ